MECNENSSVIIDNGTGMVKLGLSGNEAPRKHFPNNIAYSRYPQLQIGLDEVDFLVGEEAFGKRGIMNLKEPVEKGIITDFDSMENIWHYCLYNELKIDPSEHPVLISENPQNPIENKAKSAEIFFENFNSKAFMAVNQAILALVAFGQTKGVVLTSGEGITFVNPIYECYSLPSAIDSLDICGRDITNRLMDLLIQSGLTFSKDYDNYIIKQIKETKSYISINYDEEIK